MKNELSILFIAVFVALTVTLLIEFKRFKIPKGILLTGGAIFLTALLLFFTYFFNLLEKTPGQPETITTEAKVSKRGNTGIQTPAMIEKNDPVIKGSSGVEQLPPPADTKVAAVRKHETNAIITSDAKQISQDLQTPQKPVVSQPAEPNLTIDIKRIPGQFPETSMRQLSDEELKNRTSQELRIMRNEIFARHSYIFKSKKLSDHFKQFSWYTPKNLDISRKLSAIETSNIRIISKYEKLNH